MNNKTLPSADIKSKNVKEPLLPKESKGELRMSQSMKKWEKWNGAGSPFGTGNVFGDNAISILKQ